jgi:hypothetical protein
MYGKASGQVAMIAADSEGGIKLCVEASLKKADVVF